MIVDGLESYKDMIGEFESLCESVSEFDWIVFYANAEPDDVKIFKDLDRKYPQNFIVTVQTDDNLTSKYFI